MGNPVNFIVKLRDLAKDENSFEELLNIFSELEDNSKKLASSSFELKGSFCQFEGYFWTKFDPTDLSKIQYSESIKKITGYTNQELSQLPGKLLSIVHPEDYDKIKRKYTDILTGSMDSFCKVRYRILSKDKKMVWIGETFFMEKDDKGNITQCHSLASNITDFMNRETDLEVAYKDLKILLDERDRFINIISHDLRSPFTSLLGFSEILINEPNLTNSEQIEYLQYIHDASKIQLQFINHLLDWSRLKTGKITIDPKRLLLKDIISNQVSLVTRSAVSKNLDINVHVNEELYVSVDERLMGDAIGNLLQNAIKFSESNKRIFIAVNEFKQGMVEVVVKDEGIGIVEEHQSKLFRIDQKYITKGTKGDKGSGMGLNLVKEIVQKHGGEVWFYSKPGEGSEFHITIPEAQNVVLLVEDDPEVRQLYKKLVDSSNIHYRIKEANNGYEAMSNIFSEMPSLVITDHDMPLMNGIQLVEAIRKKDRRFLIPVIVISAKFDEDVIEKYKQFGVEHLIPKPFDTSMLSDIIKSSLR
ncbi:MAG: response regulator [Bacteroidetes bacterium]|nr:response regulator [Bacteroidota bacterium]